MKLGAFRGPFQQEEYKPCFMMLCAILEGLLPLEGRSVLQIICRWLHLKSCVIAAG